MSETDRLIANALSASSSTSLGCSLFFVTNCHLESEMWGGSFFFDREWKCVTFRKTESLDCFQAALIGRSKTRPKIPRVHPRTCLREMPIRCGQCAMTLLDSLHGVKRLLVVTFSLIVGSSCPFLICLKPAVCSAQLCSICFSSGVCLVQHRSA